jgi:hypothetical protein
MTPRPQKIIFGEMRASGVRDVHSDSFSKTKRAQSEAASFVVVDRAVEPKPAGVQAASVSAIRNEIDLLELLPDPARR